MTDKRHVEVFLWEELGAQEFKSRHLSNVALAHAAEARSCMGTAEPDQAILPTDPPFGAAALLFIPNFATQSRPQGIG